MKISRLQLEDENRVPLYQTSHLSPGLNVIALESDARGGALTDLLHVVLYGPGGLQREWSAPHVPCGSLDVNDTLGSFRLRRGLDNRGECHFTVASLDGREVIRDVIDQLRQDLPVEVAHRVFAANGRRGDQLGELLSESVARAFHDLDQRRRTRREPEAASGYYRDGYHGSSHHSGLLSRRDELAGLIEQRLAERRGRSAEIDREIQEIDADTERLVQQRERVDRQRVNIEAELSAIEARLRYEAISEAVNRETDRRDLSTLTPQLDDLEQQIERWRETLAELEQRESRVRSELAAIHPDDCSPTISLEDQRAGLTVCQRLLYDLEGEVARLARAADSNACVCRDAHPRINPLVETLAKQVSRLVDLSDQQELAFKAQLLKSELEHLMRSQGDLQQQLEHLLSRRQELWRTTRAKRDATVAVPREDDDRRLRPRPDLENELAELERELADIDASLERLAARRRERHDQRTHLLSAPEFESLQAELSEVQRRLRETPAVEAAHYRPADKTSPWRASELFARLTDGEWTGLRLVRDGRELAATDRYGRQLPARELPSAERRLAALALRLSMVATAADCGVTLPLVLDDPFAGLNAKQSSTLATVLEDFGRSGRQTFVSTGDSAALSRFTSLGVNMLRHEPVARKTYHVETIAAEPRPAESLVTRSETTVSREYLLSPEDAIDRFPAPIRDRETVFARARIRTIADLLGADPSAVAEELDRDDVTAELVALWQTHLAFVCFVPGASFDDAIVLTGAGVLSPSQLADIEEDELARRVERYLDSDSGLARRQRGYSFGRERASKWISDARRGRQKWSDSASWNAWRRHRGVRRQYVERNGSARSRSESQDAPRSLRIRTERAERSSRPQRAAHSERSQRSKSSSKRREKALRFHLETSSPIVDAPSIGPKTAKKLEKVGLFTVKDLIDCDPERIAEQLDSSRIDAETLVAWQHQAQLVCRIPELRGHDAQILVECGFTRPEEIASMKPAELFGFVEPFCQTSEAQRILRNGKAPDLAEVSDWISWSRQCRVLGAA